MFVVYSLEILGVIMTHNKKLVFMRKSCCRDIALVVINIKVRLKKMHAGTNSIKKNVGKAWGETSSSVHSAFLLENF